MDEAQKVWYATFINLVKLRAESKKRARVGAPSCKVVHLIIPPCPRELLYQGSQILLRTSILSFSIADHSSLIVIKECLTLINSKWMEGAFQDLSIVILAAMKMKAICFRKCLVGFLVDGSA